MAMNIVKLVTDQLGSNFADTAREVTGLGAERADATVRGAVPAVIAGVMNAVQTKSGRTALGSILDNQDPGLLGNISSMLGGGNRETLMSTGVQWMSSLLGENKLSGLSQAIGRFGGVGERGGRSLIGMIAPVVLGFLGKQSRAGNLGVDGIVKMLAGQRANVANALPDDLAASMQSAGVFEGLGDTARAASRSAADASRDTAARASAPLHAARDTRPRRSLWPVIAGILAVLGIGWLLVQGFDRGAERTAAGNNAPRTGEVASAANLRVGNVDVGQEFTSITDGLGRTLRSVRDEASARDALPQLNEIGADIDRLAPLVRDLPENVKPAFADVVQRSVGPLRAEANRVAGLESIPDTFKQGVTSVMGKIDSMLTAARGSGRG